MSAPAPRAGKVFIASPTSARHRHFIKSAEGRTSYKEIHNISCTYILPNCPEMTWQASAKEFQEALEASIPAKWKVDPALKEGLQDVTGIPETCGLLSAEDLHITGLDASTLVKMLACGEISAVRVTEAFCARAAIAHQLVRPLKIRNLRSFFTNLNSCNLLLGQLPYCFLPRQGH